MLQLPRPRAVSVPQTPYLLMGPHPRPCPRPLPHPALIYQQVQSSVHTQLGSVLLIGTMSQRRLAPTALLLACLLSMLSHTATAFYTVRNKKVCASAKDEWVKAHLTRLSAKLKTLAAKDEHMHGKNSSAILNN
ncbi:hypothetical protein MATL_G00242870 [Megalops atlanticus]|uniref:Uncharacterized protein n=1 Tax=Megalops atlanticus TaxID=7932 RepID=A0A9D3PCS4_MEGAT|nr:hypothetical protein MATL_G00242870 [Megalops atlanticus]